MGCVAAPAAAAAPEPLSAEQLTLRLPDLGPNYVTGVHFDCAEEADGVGGPAPVERLAKRFDLSWCMRDFHRIWVAPGAHPGPFYVKSAALLFENDADARAALDVERELAAWVAKPRTARAPTPALGESTVAYDFAGIPFAMIPARKGTVVAWRSGRFVGLTATWGRSPSLIADTDGLAAAQQRRVDAPTPLARSDFDYRFAALHDPSLGASVPWLGMRFAPRDGLPPLRFGDSSNSTGEGPGRPVVSLRYFGPRDVTSLELWRPRQWTRFKRSRNGRFIFANICASRRIRTRNGPARLYADNDLRRCTSRSPAHRFAAIRAGGFVVTINGPLCGSCWDRPRRANPYETWPGLRAILRGLRSGPSPFVPGS